MQELTQVVTEVEEVAGEEGNIITNNKKISYYNIPMSFDIETSSFYDDGNKVAIMYIWMFAIRSTVIIGRTWEEFIDLTKILIDKFDLSENKRLLIYVHNLSFEFQFIRKHFEWSKVFSLDKRKPVYATTNDGLEFRCSYILSGYSLDNVSKNLTKYKVRKLVGNLDYEKIRHYKTELTKEELDYCVNDVLVVTSYIQETIERCGDITRIPLTKTGFVRDFCRRYCYYDNVNGGKRNSNQYKKYRDLILSLKLDAITYLRLKEAFAGGFTHANPFKSGKTIKNVWSYDLTSSYPAVMVAEKFPMTSPQRVEIKSDDDLDYYLSKYCCLFRVEFTNLKASIFYENYISASHCCFKIDGVDYRGTETHKHPKYIENNGRVVYTEKCRITITEVDWDIIKRFYSWDSCKILTFTIFGKQYLPSKFVEALLSKYNDKTKLKGVVGKEAEYLASKGDINSFFGMAVTDICREEIIYPDDYDSSIKKEKTTIDYDYMIEKENKSRNRFLYYPWGVWVTAYARRNLFSAILSIGGDYIYSDTDSVKFTNGYQHEQYFENYNNQITRKIEKALAFHGLPLDLARPKNIKGNECQLGVWDFEGVYEKFKTLGAKRYMVKKKDVLLIPVEGSKEKYETKIIEKDGDKYYSFDYSLTVSGLNKNYAIPYMLKEYGGDIMKKFNDRMDFPDYATGKMTHTYIDNELNGYVADYNGVIVEYKEQSAIHLSKASYTLSLAQWYVDYLLGISTYEK